MEKEHIPTLWDFFFEKGVLSDEQWKTLREHLPRAVPRPVLDEARGVVEKSVKEALDVSIVDIVAGAWKSYGELREYCDEVKHPPEEIAHYTGLKRTIESKHNPSIDVLVNDQEAVKIKFEVKLALKIDAVGLEIQAGRIKEIQTGTCQGEGTLKCESVELATKKTASFPLPGRISFGEGLRIAPNGRRPTAAASR